MVGKNIMYKNEGVSVTYSPKQDTYIFLLSSTMSPNKTRLFLDQRLLDEFSSNDINHLSSKLPLIGADYDLSRTDVERIHGAIIGTMEKFQVDFQDFVKKEDL